IPVLDLAVIDDGHRLEALVRMGPDAAAMPGRLEFHRTRMIEHDKGAHMHALVVARQQGADGKAVANPVMLRRRVDSKELSHDTPACLAGLVRRSGLRCGEDMGVTKSFPDAKY